MKKFICALLLSTAIGFASDLNYSVCLESWDAHYVSAYQGLVHAPQVMIRNYEGVTLNLNFATYEFTATDLDPSGINGTNFNGLYANQDAPLTEIVEFVHLNGGKVQIAFGGNSYAEPYAPNYFISQTPNWPHNIDQLAAGVAKGITTLNLDGVDFDIEDPQPANSTPQEFAEQLTTFLKAVRAALPTKTITLTIPAQGWGQYWQYLAQNVASSKLVTAINFMEYDIWINSQVAGYVEQVQADLVTYMGDPATSPGSNQSPGWGIPAHLIQLGMMPGNDDNKKLMTVSDAKKLTQFAMDNGLAGVFIWDINRDAQTSLTPLPFYPSAPYAFSTAIRSTLAGNAHKMPFYATRKPNTRFINKQPNFTKQTNPLNGAPANQ